MSTVFPDRLAQDSMQIGGYRGQARFEKLQPRIFNVEQVYVALGESALTVGLIRQDRLFPENLPFTACPTAGAVQKLESHYPSFDEIERITRCACPEYLLSLAQMGLFQMSGHLPELIDVEVGQQGEAAQPLRVHRLGPRGSTRGRCLVECRPYGRELSHKFFEVGSVQDPQIRVADGRGVLYPVLAGVNRLMAPK